MPGRRFRRSEARRVDAHDLLLQSRDGTEVAAFAARAERPSGAGIVILPDVRGLHPYYVDLAARFAEAGVHAVAIDLYARTAGPHRRDAGFEYEPHVLQLTADALNDDVAAATAFLRSAEGGDAERLSTVGFCIGGRISLLQAAAGHELAGVIGCLSVAGRTASQRDCRRRRTRHPASAARCSPSMAAPMPASPQRHARRSPQPSTPRAFRIATVVYPDAPHSFFDRKSEEYAADCADAWRQILDFMGVAEPAE